MACTVAPSEQQKSQETEVDQSHLTHAPPYSCSTPTKQAHLGEDGKPPSPAKLNSPSEWRYLPQTPIRFGPRTSNDGDAKDVAEWRRVRQRMTPTKPVARFDSLCDDSRAILSDMAEMFSPGKVETKKPEESPFKIKPVLPAKKTRSLKDRHDGQRKEGQPRRKMTVNFRQVRRSAHSPAGSMEAQNPHGEAEHRYYIVDGPW